jgi:hypothetical protein
MYFAFTEYQAKGGELSQIDFERAETAARKEIDYHTFNRLQGIDPIPDDLKMCTLELIQRGFCGSLDGQDFISQGSGRLSGTKEDRKGKAAELIRKYLDGMTIDGIPVFYSGN